MEAAWNGISNFGDTIVVGDQLICISILLHAVLILASSLNILQSLWVLERLVHRSRLFNTVDLQIYVGNRSRGYTNAFSGTSGAFHVIGNFCRHVTLKRRNI